MEFDGDLCDAISDFGVLRTVFARKRQSSRQTPPSLTPDALQSG